MNIALIEHNIRQLEQKAQQGDGEEAARLALALARLILQTPSPAQPRNLYGAYAGVASTLRQCYDTLLENYSPTSDIEQMLGKIQEVNACIEECGKEREAVVRANKELLDGQKALEEQKAELEALKDNVAKLTAVKEKEIPELRREIDRQKEKLKSLEEECAAALEEKERWQAVFDENNRLIINLPDSVMDQDADAIIAEAKEYALRARQADEEGDQWLRRVIGAIMAGKERMKDPLQT